MASLSIPAPSAPASRLDWGHSGERGSAFRGSGKTRGGGRGDRGRGGRGSGRGGSSSSSSRNPRAPNGTSSTESSTHTTSLSSKSTHASLPAPPPLAIADLPPKPKAGPRRGGQQQQQPPKKLPSLTIEPASPTVSTNTSSSAPHSASPNNSSRPTARRRRSHNKAATPVVESTTLTVETLASALRQQRRTRSGPSSPHTSTLPRANDALVAKDKDAPPHLAGAGSVSAGPTTTTFAAKTNIDSLVEHVRALAMDHGRPATPGSHIDWAGDDDDSLPDLDDWGVPSSASVPASVPAPVPAPAPVLTEQAKLQLMSPILDDSLKQLPQSFDRLASGALSPPATAPPTVDVPGSQEPPLPSEGAPQEGDASTSAPADPRPVASSPAQETTKATERDVPPHLAGAASDQPAPTSASTAVSETGSAHSVHAPADEDTLNFERAPNTTARGLAASIHAPAPSSRLNVPAPDESSPRPASAPAPAPAPVPPATPASAPPFQPAHGRSRTLGRAPPFSAGGGGKRAFAEGAGHHARTQSTPPSAGARQHRRVGSRPVITGDAMSRLARTLGTATRSKKEGGAAAVAVEEAVE
ncbi:hypothetical protein BC834DRAFT_196081 [Gloeopeniophorella convolvens]|nr:hypothetical protein BC834DRAFT_196081 [Gloeopeniophorella convolvens]